MAETTVAKIIDERPVSPLQIRIIVLCSLVAFVDGYDLQAMGLAVQSMSASWGVAPPAFKYAQSAALFGIAFASIFLGPLGDRWGRKPIIVGGLVFMGVASLGVALSNDPNQVAFWRILVGIGYGTIHGNATALTAEYAPLRSRALLMTLMGCNVALGGMVAGLTAEWLIDHWGWQGLFIVGGAAPVLLAAFMLTAPDSLQILFTRNAKDPRIADTLRRIAPDADTSQLVAPADMRGKPAASALDLLRPPLLERTLRLWLIYVFNTFLLYLLISWLPVLLSDAGWTRAASFQGIVLFQLGGIAGALLLSLYVDRGQTVPALICSYCFGAVAALMFVVLPHTALIWSLLILALGLGISGAMFALMALGAIFYPPQVRAAGFSWNAAVSRIGAVLGPLAGGWVMEGGTPSNQIIAWLAVPALISAFIALSLRGVLQRARAAQSAT